MSLTAHAQQSLSAVEAQLKKALRELRPIENRLDEAERELELCVKKAECLVEDVVRTMVEKMQGAGDGGFVEGEGVMQKGKGGRRRRERGAK